LISPVFIKTISVPNLIQFYPPSTTLSHTIKTTYLVCKLTNC